MGNAEREMDRPAGIHTDTREKRDGPNRNEVERLRSKYRDLNGVMDERMRRLWAATEAAHLGRGGIGLVARATGLARNTIAKGMSELAHLAEHPDEIPVDRIRAPGAGRRPLAALDGDLLHLLEELLPSASPLGSQQPFRWTFRSTANLAQELKRRGHPVSDRTVAKLLRRIGCSLPPFGRNRDQRPGYDRQAQVDYVIQQVAACQAQGVPVLSLELNCRELRAAPNASPTAKAPNQPQSSSPTLPACEYAVDLALLCGLDASVWMANWTTIPISGAVACSVADHVRHWWRQMGVTSFADETKLMLVAHTAANEQCQLLWKIALQELADTIQIPVHFSYLPSCIGKWTNVRLRTYAFSDAGLGSAAGKSYRTVLSLVGPRALDEPPSLWLVGGSAQPNKAATAAEEKRTRLCVTEATFHPEWNYTILPDR